MIPHNKPFIDKKGIDVVGRTLRSGWIAQGEKVSEFEKSICRFLNSKGEAAAVSSGTAALFLAMYSLDIGKGDEVLLPTYTCSALLNAIYMIEAKPVLVDCDGFSFNISYSDAKKKITKKTRAIIIPHMFGYPADVAKFKKLGIPIIEDCAQTIGIMRGSKMVGTVGTLAIFSFYATKLLAIGQGGMIFSKNKKLIKKIKDYREFDCRKTYKQRFNFQMTDFQAALGISQLKQLPSLLQKRRKIANRYAKILGNKKEIAGSAVYRFTLETSGSNQKLLKYFHRNKINAIIPIERYELLHRYIGQNPKKFPNAEYLASKIVSIPVFPAMSENQIKKVESVLKKLSL